MSLDITFNIFKGMTLLCEKEQTVATEAQRDTMRRAKAAGGLLVDRYQELRTLWRSVWSVVHKFSEADKNVGKVWSKLWEIWPTACPEHVAIPRRVSSATNIIRGIHRRALNCCPVARATELPKHTWSQEDSTKRSALIERFYSLCKTGIKFSINHILVIWIFFNLSPQKSTKNKLI